jgi:pimeloyl-ACP methyl ester carboxylesterase
LGESGLCYAESFASPELASFNLIVPDLVGFGRSSAAADGDYSFRTQAERIWQALDQLGVERVTLVGHSMSGDLVTLMADWGPRGRIQALVNVEGALSIPDDLFISSQAKRADDRGQFSQWFDDFVQTQVFERWGPIWPSCRRYFASLQFSRPDAFRVSARELVRYNGEAVGESRVSEVGRLFSTLDLPKVFCWGRENLDRQAPKPQPRVPASQQQAFAGASHWVMVDQPGEFYPFLGKFCEKLVR